MPRASAHAGSQTPPAGGFVPADASSQESQQDAFCLASTPPASMAAPITATGLVQASDAAGCLPQENVHPCKRLRAAPSDDRSSQEDSCMEEASTAADPDLFDPAAAPRCPRPPPAAPAPASGDLSCSEGDVFWVGHSSASSTPADDDLTAAQSPTPAQRRPAPAAPRPPAPRPPAPPPAPVDADIAAMLRVLCDAESLTAADPRALAARHGPDALGAGHLTAGMRRTAAGWLVEVAAEFRLQQETLHLGASLMDRFLCAARAVPRAQLQLAAVACLLVAAKHEEEVHPSVQELVRIADNSFTPADLLRMESAVLSALSFRVNAPTAHTFLCLLRGALAMAPHVFALGAYLTELAMLEQSMVALPPSHVAAGAAALAATYFDDLPTLRALPALIPAAAPALGCMHALLELQHAAFAPRTERSPTLPVSDKFSAPGWHHAALMPPMQQLAGVAVAARHAAR